MNAAGDLLTRLLRSAIERPFVPVLLVLGIVAWGLVVAPFDLGVRGLPRSPVQVDAIPDLGENQQIVFTEWPGRSPQDVEDQITYPLTLALLGVPGVDTIRSQSFFGFSSVYVIFDEDTDFYWSRSRVLERLSSLAPDSLPADVRPTLGPDATALGQVFWYTLEGRDSNGQPTGGWGLEELRSIQDWQVRHALLAAKGVSEVASVGGFVEEYHIDLDPNALQAYNLGLEQVFEAVRGSNLDIGARSIEINRVEYVIRGTGSIDGLADIEQIPVALLESTPVRLSDIARVIKGPALRRGVLDKAGREAVGGVVVVRQGFNPLEAIDNTKEKIAEIAPGLPSKALVDHALTSMAELGRFAARQGFDGVVENRLRQPAWVDWLRAHPRAAWPEGVRLSQVTLVPFYDRSTLIEETLNTLYHALKNEALITLLVILFMLRQVGPALAVSALLPLSVIMTFIAMRGFGVAANIVALSGIAIAIGTLVDLGVIISENIRRHLDAAEGDADRGKTILAATREVAGALLTSVATTVISFLPVFALTGAEGKLFAPLAFTKTAALLAALLCSLALLPMALRWLADKRAFAGAVRARVSARVPAWLRRYASACLNGAMLLAVTLLLAGAWRPLGLERTLLVNWLFVVFVVGALLFVLTTYQRHYPRLLAVCLAHKRIFMAAPVALVLFGLSAFAGFDSLFRIAPEAVRESSAWQATSRALPGFGNEFMPSLDEGSFLYMPTTMPHASIGEAHDVLQILDRSIASLPEIESVVGKLGRAETALDPAPISMFEIQVNYHSEYRSDAEGRVLAFAFDEEKGEFERDAKGALVRHAQGRPYRQWREHIHSPDDIWQEILAATNLPGTTSAPRLQPIAARIVMLQSGMRSPMGIKVKGPDIETIAEVALQVEARLRHAPGIRPQSVSADRPVGKPYLEIDLDRAELARHGLKVSAVQRTIEAAVGSRRATTTIEGRERHPVRIRYLREMRDSPEDIARVLISTSAGAQIPLGQLAEIKFTRGPQSIKSEDTFPVAYVVFDKRSGLSPIDVARAAKSFLDERIERGELHLPAGVSLSFSGDYEHQLRAQETLAIIVPLALALILAILYLQFSSLATAGIVFTGIALAWAGGFVLIWCYNLPGFLDFSLFGENLRDVFQIRPINMSVAVWVGFLALFGIATDNGVVTATYLDQSFKDRQGASRSALRAAVIAGATRRIRPALMTTATTLIALLPVLTSDGRGADIMMPMAIPVFGGMLAALLGTLLVPVLYSAVKEAALTSDDSPPD